jgi:mRNA interferase RelE/StbE
MAYEIHFVPAAARQLKKIKTKADKRLIADAVRGLASNPLPKGFSTVEGLPEFYRVKAREYRIVYTINENEQIVVVGRIAHRREVYRRLADVATSMKVFVSRRKKARSTKERT